MTSDEVAASSRQPMVSRLKEWFATHWALGIGLAALVIPTLITLARESWGTEAGAHAPIVLATGLWLLFNCTWTADQEGRERFGNSALAGIILIALPIYIFGRAYEYLVLEAGAVYLTLILVGVITLGPKAIWRNAFPIFYMAFLVPPPGWIIDQLTLPLQHLISYSATEMLYNLGYPIARSGVALTIGPYALLVEQACSGMNSLIGLTAITLFYIYILHRASWRYSLLLVALILPVAVFVNFLRVITLILLTHYYGDAVAQGFLHNSAGIVLFAVALAIMVVLDTLLQALFFKRGRA